MEPKLEQSLDLDLQNSPLAVDSARQLQALVSIRSILKESIDNYRILNERKTKENGTETVNSQLWLLWQAAQTVIKIVEDLDV